MSGITELADFDNGGGICIHLQSDNLCDIYERRPLVCNVEEMYHQVFASILTWEEYVKANSTICDRLIGKDESAKRIGNMKRIDQTLLGKIEIRDGLGDCMEGRLVIDYPFEDDGPIAGKALGIN